MAGPFSSLPEVPQIDLGVAMSDAGTAVSGFFGGEGGGVSAGVDSDGGFSLGGVVKSAGGAISGAISDIGGKFGFGGVGAGGALMPKQNRKGFNGAQFVSQGAPDWRVKIKIPQEYMTLAGDGIFKPFKSTDECLVFPYTPTISLQTQAKYTPSQPIHSNYPFHSYQNSSTESISVTGDFTVETEDEGKYWIAMNHFFRSASKMAYGENSILPTGSPPPVLKLSGYGDHIFNKVSVVINSYSVILEPGIDYMLIKDFHGDNKGTYVPINSTVTANLFIIQSRQKVKTFSLDSFVRGDYVKSGEFI